MVPLDRGILQTGGSAFPPSWIEDANVLAFCSCNAILPGLNVDKRTIVS
jgi:hypothetical protein